MRCFSALQIIKNSHEMKFFMEKQIQWSSLNCLEHAEKICGEWGRIVRQLTCRGEGCLYLCGEWVSREVNWWHHDP